METIYYGLADEIATNATAPSEGIFFEVCRDSKVAKSGRREQDWEGGGGKGALRAGPGHDVLRKAGIVG